MTQEHQTPALGISGRIASFFQSAQITPLLALVAFLLYSTRWGLRVRAVGEHPKAAAYTPGEIL